MFYFISIDPVSKKIISMTESLLNFPPIIPGNPIVLKVGKAIYNWLVISPERFIFNIETKSFSRILVEKIGQTIYQKSLPE